MRRGLAIKAPESHPVKCRGCQRTVRVILSDRYPPCFHHFEQQADCPQIQLRRRKGEGNLLVMMCRALNESLAETLESAEVKPVLHEGSWHVVCRVEGERAQFYSPSQARVQAEFWRNSGRTTLADQFQDAANRAEVRTRSVRGSWRVPAAIGLVCGCVVAMTAATWHSHRHRSARSAVTAVAPSQPDVSDRQLVWKPMGQPSEEDVSGVERRPPESAGTSSPDVLPPHRVSTVPVRPLSPLVSNEPEMVLLSGGTFSMGSGRDGSEMPVHRVTIKAFEMSKFPITVHEWNECVAAKACENVTAGEDDAPVTNVSWSDAKQFVGWLMQRTQKDYRLPSEAEWEYAARGGTETDYWWGDQLKVGIADCKGCGGSYNGKPTKVGSLAANPFDLYDMGGGVDQWVEDCWHNGYLGAPNDGSPWVEAGCASHVIRSGSWENDASYARVASRDHYDTEIRYPTHGFRVARSP
jgi:formylglycine-generating enzyme required for sulfatase activity